MESAGRMVAGERFANFGYVLVGLVPLGRDDHRGRLAVALYPDMVTAVCHGVEDFAEFGPHLVAVDPFGLLRSHVVSLSRTLRDSRRERLGKRAR